MPDHDKGQASLPLLAALLPHLIQRGALTITDTQGGRSRFGPRRPGPDVVIRLHERTLPIRLALDPTLATGEAYMDGSLTTEQGDVRDFLLVATSGLERMNVVRSGWLLTRLLKILDRLAPTNDRRRARSNVTHHYDLPPGLYDPFLDRNRLYSCAYFRNGSEGLEEAQQAKVRHIMAKLLLCPGHRVLDIGCGWGALATTIAEETGASVTGLTLSDEQLAGAAARARRRRLADRAVFALRDYRDETGSYDRVVSVGMLEHVGRQYLEE